MTPNSVPSIPSREAVEALAYHCEHVLRADTVDWDECPKCQSLAPTLRSLLAEVERLTRLAAYDSELSLERVQRIATLTATVSAQAAELEKVRKDAERYRWLRQPFHTPLHIHGDLMDEYIDDALDSVPQSASQMDAPPHSSG